MLIKSRLLFLLLFSGLFSLLSFSQSATLITNYSRSDYSAGSQNWSTAVDSRGIVYIANSKGLLVYDGTHWKLNPLPSRAIVRSVHIGADNRIYVGSFEEFGYWIKDKTGDLCYHSLKPLLKGFRFHNNEIWRIVELNGKIYFQGFSALFVYDGKEVRSISIPNSVVFLLKSNNRLFLQSVNGTLYELLHEKLYPIPGSNIFEGTEVKSVLPFDDSTMLIGTSTKGIYQYDGKAFKPWANEANEDLKNYQINNGILSGSYYVYGTIVKGVFILDRHGRLLHHFHTGNRLQNNTVLSLCADHFEGIWTGLDMGLSYLSLHNLLDIYQEKADQLGSVYSAALFENKLYIGTNRGVFRYNAGEGYEFDGLIDKSQGQVWQLKVVDGALLCGHNNGTFRIEPDGMHRISDVNGGFSIQKLYKNGKEYLIQSTYTSLVIYYKVNNNWQLSHQVKGFLDPCRFLETDHLGNVWVSHSVKGLFRLQLNEELDSVVQIQSFGKKDGLPSDYAIGVFKVANRVVFTTGSKLYTWDDLHGKIIRLDELNNKLEGFENAGSIVSAGKNDYWFIKGNDIGLFEIANAQVKRKFRLLLPLYGVSMVDLYENIVSLNDSLNLICLDDGFAVFNTQSLKNHQLKASELIWNGISCYDAEGNRIKLDPSNETVTIRRNFHNISFSFSLINYASARKLFQYKLEGIDAEWCNWTEKSDVSYTRLPKGKYIFQVRTISVSGQVSKPMEFSFEVLPAWYASQPAYFIYFLMGMFLIWLIIFMAQRRLRKQHEMSRIEDLNRQEREKKQAEQAIIELQNEKLHAEISHKNMQLADSTMSIIRKNEVLIDIKNELAKQKENLGSRYPVRYFDKINLLIDRNISNDADWQVFEALFDQAHENFFKRLKQSYPDLTQSDLKLCAYLKLNLSSKEIAPLLNITLRGVEIRRYRLRKRLGLGSDENLVKAIMQF
ncbi:MAG: hypothetical protein IPH88_07170 [Bacteroidales bacterium]|nr:hypothetical protein [Bacteroidales bacterium]